MASGSGKVERMREMDVCWEILPKVSRSFALAIRLLPKPLSGQTMLAYLVYRLIDTIEDSHAPLSLKRRLFDSLLGALARGQHDSAESMRVRELMLSKIDCTYERGLIERLPEVAAAFYAQPPEVRAVTLRWGKEMARGMLRFQRRPIRTFADQSRYAHYVAGVVGYMFNDLLYLNRIISKELRDQLRGRARRFGLALQKVNILRDVAHDVPKKRYYWPVRVMERYELDYETLLVPENRRKAMAMLREEVDDAMQYLQAGIQYVTALPKEELGVRLFCLIPLFMAVESYLACVNNADVFDGEKTVKITRQQVGEIVLRSNLLGREDGRLVEWFETRMSAVRAGVRAMEARPAMAAARRK
ncbi:MAG: squalene/phytoene synthase family protein [Candidatus Marsarchaeota archaeon]|nr:squalene/phytoene synthase family protein [Candidatus Marsarchaeota archaeon]